MGLNPTLARMFHGDATMQADHVLRMLRAITEWCGGPPVAGCWAGACRLDTGDRGIGMTDKRVEPLQAQGKTVVFILIDGKLKGAIALADIVRPEAKQAIDALKALNIRCTDL